MSERDTSRPEPAEQADGQPAEGREVPHGTDEHADSDPARRQRGDAPTSAPQKPDNDRGRRDR